ncbi:hypothetical protein GOB81_05930 [Acetobacter sp. LMG 1627]|uniref:Uncharacterized protein n=2 Tax=Acetobacter conturbans TaxID=1737472 RepID=A0ABX0K3Y9_9PROT|nr:hypothetical protein [Acetobacter conturbans]
MPHFIPLPENTLPFALACRKKIPGDALNFYFLDGLVIFRGSGIAIFGCFFFWKSLKMQEMTFFSESGVASPENAAIRPPTTTRNAVPLKKRV